MYDYYLGGSHNFAIDREAAREVMAATPDAPLMAQANRAFLRRIVRHVIDAGVTQFLDLGSGIPTAGNVHEIAQAAAPDARVIYVDTDPEAVAHSREILAGNGRAVAVEADLREPAAILADPDVRTLLDFDAPIALLMVAVLHYVPDSDDPAGIIGRFRDALAPGSYLALSHATGTGRPAAEVAADEVAYRRTTRPLTLRDHPQVVRLFDGFDLIDPGVVWISRWRPDGDVAVAEPARSALIGGLGCKP